MDRSTIVLGLRFGTGLRLIACLTSKEVLAERSHTLDTPSHHRLGALDLLG
jgi:hypothetical protein